MPNCVRAGGLGSRAAVVRRFMNRIPAALDTSRLRTLMTSRRFLLTLLAIVTGALLLAPVAGADLSSPESGGSPNADDIDTLYKFIFAVAIVVFVGVEGVLLYSVFKFKATQGRASPPRSAATRAWRSAGRSAPR